MAGYNGELRIRQPSKPAAGAHPTTADLSDTPDTIKIGILQPRGIIPVKHTLGSPATTAYFALSTLSADLAAVRQLVTSGNVANLDLTYGLFDTNGSPSSPEYSTYEAFATVLGATDKVYANGVATNFAVTARKSGGASSTYIEGYIQHWSPGGAIITDVGGGDIFNQLLTTTMTKYTVSKSLQYKWDTSDRLVMQYRFRNEGIPV